LVQLNDREKALTGMVADLENSDAVSVDFSELGPGTEWMDDPAEVLIALDGMTSLAEFQRCPFRFTKVAASWRTVKPYPLIHGEFSVTPLPLAFATGAPHMAWEGSTDEERQLYSEFRVVDDTPTSGEGLFTALRAPTEIRPIELWLYYIRLIPHKPPTVQLEIDYCEYLDMVHLTKGVFGWQFLFADVSFSDWEWGLSGLAQDAGRARWGAGGRAHRRLPAPDLLPELTLDARVGDSASVAAAVGRALEACDEMVRDAPELSATSQARSDHGHERRSRRAPPAALPRSGEARIRSQRRCAGGCGAIP
jgi:hypothetical protein